MNPTQNLTQRREGAEVAPPDNLGDQLDRELKRVEAAANEMVKGLDAAIYLLGGEKKEPVSKNGYIRNGGGRITGGKFVVPTDVMKVLKQSRFEGNNLFLPDLFHDKPLYGKVMKVVISAGGKWNRKAQAHVFPSDAREKLGMVLETGIAVNEKQAFQAFYTPKELAAELVQWANVTGCRVLEPSAGYGSLVDACHRLGAGEIDCIEIRPEAAKELRSRDFVQTFQDDFLQIDPSESYDRVVMNPPFTKGQDVKHVAHALKFLKPGGVLVSIISAGKSRDLIAKTLIGHEWLMRDIPAGSFKESGTGVATVMVRVVKQEVAATAMKLQASAA